MTGKCLSQYGAEVIRVETEDYPDLLRQLLFKDNEAGHHHAEFVHARPDRTIRHLPG